MLYVASLTNRTAVASNSPTVLVDDRTGAHRGRVGKIVVAYGEPTAVIVRCGVEEPGPTSTLPCVLVEDGSSTYWLRDDSDAPNYVFTTYGRSPATEVIINRDIVAPGAVLYELVDTVARTTETGKCTEIEDSLG